MQIKVSVDQVTLDTVVGQTLEHDDEGYRAEGDPVTVADKVAKLIKKEAMKSPDWQPLVKKVAEIRDEEIREAVKPLIAEALQKPIRKTNGWGEAYGEETTLAEIIADEARKVFTAKNDPYNRDKRSFVQHVVEEEVKRAFRRDIADQVAKARQALAEQIGKELSDQVSKAALDVLKERS